MLPFPSWLLIALVGALIAQTSPLARSAIVTARSSESVAALLASGRRQISPQVSPAAEQQQQQQPLLSLPQLSPNPQQRDSAAAKPAIPILSAIQSQAQRQLSQLNGLVMAGAPNLAASNSTASQQVGNVLEVLSNVGKAIQQQIMNGPIGGNPNNRFVSIVTSPGSGSNELATSKKNEYQSIVVNDNQQLNLPASNPVATLSQQNELSAANQTANNVDHRQQSELLRQEIIRRASQLQQVVASSMEILKNNGDLIVRRLLEQLNSRLDQAKSKADKIINEPATTDVAIKALQTINSGLNNLNSIITNIVNRLDLSSKDGQLQSLPLVTNLGGTTQRVASNANALLEAARSRLNLHQLSQQFSSALNAVQQQRQQQQQQQQQVANMQVTSNQQPLVAGLNQPSTN